MNTHAHTQSHTHSHAHKVTHGLIPTSIQFKSVAVSYCFFLDRYEPGVKQSSISAPHPCCSATNTINSVIAFNFVVSLFLFWLSFCSLSCFCCCHRDRSFLPPFCLPNGPLLASWTSAANRVMAETKCGAWWGEQRSILDCLLTPNKRSRSAPF